MESAREHLELWLKHNAELARRQFESDIDALGKEMAARGLFYSGGRVRRAVSLGNATVTALAKLAIDKAKTLPELPDGLAMARASLEAFAADIIGRTDDVTRNAMGGPGTDGVWREVRELQKPMTTDLATLFDLAKFEYASQKYQPPSALSWQAFAERNSPQTNQTKLPSLVSIDQAMAWVYFRDEEAATAKSGHMPRLRATEGAMQSQPMRAFDAAITGRTLPIYGIAYGEGWKPVPVEALLPEPFTLGPSKLSAYGDLYVMRADLMILFPPIEGAGEAAPTQLEASDEPVADVSVAPTAAIKPLPEKALQAWWKSIRATRDSLNQVQLLRLCQAAHPSHGIARERIRALTTGRKRGRKPLSGKNTAQ